jgi:hypothetical protein
MEVRFKKLAGQVSMDGTEGKWRRCRLHFSPTIYIRRIADLLIFWQP